MAKMGVISSMEVHSDQFGSGAIFKVEGMDAFLEKYTETRDGVMYDKATGKLAAWGASGSKYSYFVW
jgi:hypothetical protein